MYVCVIKYMSKCVVCVLQSISAQLRQTFFSLLVYTARLLVVLFLLSLFIGSKTKNKKLKLKVVIVTEYNRKQNTKNKNRASMCIPQILEKVHFDPEKPENHNVTRSEKKGENF